MAGKYSISFLRAVSRDVKVRPPKQGRLAGRLVDFKVRQFNHPQEAHFGYYQRLWPNEVFEIGNDQEAHWTVDGAPFIETRDGTNTLRLSVHENPGSPTRRQVTLNGRGRLIATKSAVHFFVGNTLDGKTCYLRIEHLGDDLL